MDDFGISQTVVADSPHSHPVNPPDTQSASSGIHTHDVNIGLFDSGTPEKPQSTAIEDVLPYLQLLVCEKDAVT